MRPTRSPVPLLALALLAGLAAPATAQDAPPKPDPDTPAAPAAPSPDAVEPPPEAEFVIVPLRAHVLSSADLPDVDCHLSDADLDRIVGKVNGIWHKAGVHWALDPVVHESAARQDQFKQAREGGGPDNLDVFRLLRPDESRVEGGIDVYYIHKFAVNGVFLGDRTAFVQETAKLRPVPGGIDEPLPRVTAHELGHALGLPHRQDRTNLMASGTTGTTLNQAEAARAREHARRLPGARSVADIRRLRGRAQARGAASDRFDAILRALPSSPGPGKPAPAP